MCGEHTALGLQYDLLQGSSPHVRGARIRSREHRAGLGIIPACAGSTAGFRLRRRRCRDHPRMCGEHWLRKQPRASDTGSSPHVRGALRRRNGRRIGIGIIPACAGSTVMPSRMRLSLAGSSPHVRGAPHRRALCWCCRGIIPACAGSTHSPSPDSRSPRDHPRMCGEHSARILEDSKVVGSSPHVRGALVGSFAFRLFLGIIPACAGSTLRK